TAVRRRPFRRGGERVRCTPAYQHPRSCHRKCDSTMLTHYVAAVHRFYPHRRKETRSACPISGEYSASTCAQTTCQLRTRDTRKLKPGRSCGGDAGGAPSVGKVPPAKHCTLEASTQRNVVHRHISVGIECGREVQ